MQIFSVSFHIIIMPIWAQRHHSQKQIISIKNGISQIYGKDYFLLEKEAVAIQEYLSHAYEVKSSSKV